MEIAVLIFLSSGLFLGWSLGANDASNVFGTAVASGMVRFSVAAAICSIFIILGAVFGGAGAAHGLGALGTLNTLPGAFMAAFTAALTVLWMTKAGLPVSTTQAVVGAIVGWNLYSGSITDLGVLGKIVGTWVACPLLGAFFGALLYKITVWSVSFFKPHLLSLDAYTRWGLVLAGAFGSYSLGANNIGNVMGVFVSSSPFTAIEVRDWFTISSVQQLFLVGAIAIAVGVITYSRRVMMTVGSSLMPLNAQGAWVVVVAHSLVLFLFSSIALENLLANKGLPTIPLIPVSSSQAVVGAVIGIGLLRGRKGARLIQWRVLGNIAMGWVMTPVIAAVLCFMLLFVLQNVFNQQVYQQVYFRMSPDVMTYLESQGLPGDELSEVGDKTYPGGDRFRRRLRRKIDLNPSQESLAIRAAEIHRMRVDAASLARLHAGNEGLLSPEQLAVVGALEGETYEHRWQLYQALSSLSDSWQKWPATKVNKMHNQHLDQQLDYVYRILSLPEAK